MHIWEAMFKNVAWCIPSAVFILLQGIVYLKQMSNEGTNQLHTYVQAKLGIVVPILEWLFTCDTASRKSHE